MERFGIDDGVVNLSEFPSIGQVDVKSCPVGHDLNALDHTFRWC